MQELSNSNSLVCLHCDGRTKGLLFCSTTCRSAVFCSVQHASCPAHQCITDTGFVDHNGSIWPPPFDFSSPVKSSSDAPQSVGMMTASKVDADEALSTGNLSENVQHDLKEYSNSFDESRQLKRQVYMN